MKILVTGAGGFVGKHLLNHLRSSSAANAESDQPLELYGTVLDDNQLTAVASDTRCNWWKIDLREADEVTALLERLKPDRIYHLAGQAYVPASFIDPWDTLETNIRSTLNLLQAILILKLPTRFLNIGSAEVYGSVTAEHLPLTERSELLPSSPYSVSKIAQDMLALQYHLTHKIHTVRMRPFNHIGPGQNSRFAAADWAAQIAEAEVGQREPVVAVGNLSAARDFTDVRDVVRAYVLAMEYSRSGDVFNVCSGKPHSMQSILDSLIAHARIKIEVRIDKERFRPVDIPTLYGDYAALHQRTGWQPEIPLEQTLADVLDEWRQLISASSTSTSTTPHH
ncbi:MAG: GDP-mannose 4,6-dehydratase [Anaerolineae bacterium]|nr:GDP-mannose 4,6-dehydratase [Anaerolineae bacterium]